MGVDYNKLNSHTTFRVLDGKELERTAFCWMEVEKNKHKIFQPGEIT